MSHHLDSPLARQDVRLDITDLYVFRGETGTALVINVCHSIAGDIPVPGFHPEGKYEFKIDTNGDAVEEVTYRFVFAERDAEGRQAYEIFRGERSVARGVTGEEVTAGGLRAWAGKAGDPFWIEPDVLHAMGHAVQDGTRLQLGDWTPARAANLFAGHTVHSIVLELGDLTGTIGVWAVASLQTDAGGWRPINRIGLPMMHPLFTQYNEDLGDRLNGGEPRDDFAVHGPLVIREIAGIVAAYGTAEDPTAYATTVAHRILPNILPYTVGTPAAFSFAGFNGRSLTDNAPDVMFSLAANTPITLGIGKESITTKPTATFPYVPQLP
ncbi:hypothetical protein Ade02nite_58880 [Paractinoplanes deccanensis]|uniref:DUF4331 domain-containing protein n=1 Tax=Paractinoplanes deccanensis TaxID=113561 RepID=A0ABQ3YB98_9ACTN|nr:DUF4331 family protein [Actinoplanes deccanensis]GID77247.1 hypothetical protein Ade02nite_58880 [Actinoplanes deccanensis]